MVNKINCIPLYQVIYLFTMKDYFVNLLQYDKHSNLQMTELLLTTSPTPEAIQMMAHMLMAQKVWLSRCTNAPAPVDRLWPNWQAEQFKELIEENSRTWLDYVNSLTPDSFDQMISYRNFKGEDCNNKLTDILAHLINHGTHHRAQIGQHLKLAGIKLPITDYIYYVRQQTQL